MAALTGQPLQRIGLSATQNPIEEVARFLVGTKGLDETGRARCAIIDSGHRRKMDLAVELPGSPLEAVMSNEVWTEVYGRLAELIEGHREDLGHETAERVMERLRQGESLGIAMIRADVPELTRKISQEALPS